MRIRKWRWAGATLAIDLAVVVMGWQRDAEGPEAPGGFCSLWLCIQLSSPRHCGRFMEAAAPTSH